MIDKLFTKRLRDLTDEAIRESLAEISVEFEKRFGPAALTASPPVVERGAIKELWDEHIRLVGMDDGYAMALGKDKFFDAILALTPVEGVDMREARAAWRSVQQAHRVGDPHGYDYHAWRLDAALSTPATAQGDARAALRSAISNVPLSEPEQIGDTGRYGAAVLTTKQTDDVLAAVLQALSPLMERLAGAEMEPLTDDRPLTDEDAVFISIGDLRAVRATLTKGARDAG